MMHREAICLSLRARKSGSWSTDQVVCLLLTIMPHCQTHGCHYTLQRQSALHAHSLPATETWSSRETGGGGYSESNPKIPLRENSVDKKKLIDLIKA